MVACHCPPVKDDLEHQCGLTSWVYFSLLQGKRTLWDTVGHLSKRVLERFIIGFGLRWVILEQVQGNWGFALDWVWLGSQCNTKSQLSVPDVKGCFSPSQVNYMFQATPIHIPKEKY